MSITAIQTLTVEELLFIYSSPVDYEDLHCKTHRFEKNNAIRNSLQEKGYLSKDQYYNWTVEGKDAIDAFWYHCTSSILKELNKSKNALETSRKLQRELMIPETLYALLFSSLDL